MRFKDIRLGQKLLLQTCVYILGFLCFGFFAFETLHVMKVNGPIYSRIIQGKDLANDVAPPILNLMQANDIALEMMNEMDRSALNELKGTYELFKEDYIRRADRWRTRLPEGPVKTALTVSTYEPAKAFFTVMDEAFIPAILAGDPKKAKNIFNKDLKRHYRAHQAAIHDLMGILATQHERDEITSSQSVHNRTLALILIGIGVIGLVVFLGALMTRSIVGSLRSVIGCLKAFVEGGGDLTQRLHEKRGDEFGELATMLNTFLDKMHASIRSIHKNAQALTLASEQLSGVSFMMSSSAEETSSQSNVVSAAAEEISSSVQTVAVGMEEMSSSIKEISKNAAEVAQVAGSAVKAATLTSESISKLNNSSLEIGKVIQVITSIAEQTNLLALNATIEAARAGEAGKGFAVVANEVKELAKETAKATEDISQKVSTIQNDTQESVDAIKNIRAIIMQISDIQNSIASAVEEQTATTNEIGRNVAEAAQGSADIAQNITSVAKAANDTSSGATNTQQLATQLTQMATDLQKLVNQFKV